MAPKVHLRRPQRSLSKFESNLFIPLTVLRCGPSAHPSKYHQRRTKKQSLNMTVIDIHSMKQLKLFEASRSWILFHSLCDLGSIFCPQFLKYFIKNEAKALILAGSKVGS